MKIFTQAERRVLLHGLGRSGTSWLMKILDHHPASLTSHEPEGFVSALKGDALGSVGAIQAYIDALFDQRALRAMRKRPILRKDYRHALAHRARVGMLYGLSGLSRAVRPLAKRINRVQIPDLAQGRIGFHVVKCVSHTQAIPSLLEHGQDFKCIFIIRHPCGQIHSMLKGGRSGKMPGRYFLPDRDMMAAIPDYVTGAHDLQEKDFSNLEISAHRWAVINHHAVEAVRGSENAYLMRYEDLCADPIGEARKLFDWLGLGLHADCEAFLRQSVEAEADAEGYHDLVRNPRLAADKWRSEMPAEDVETVLSICRRTPVFDLFA